MNINEKYKNARSIIVLLAALITMLINIKYDKDILEALITLLIVIVIFIVISTIAIKLIDKIANMNDNVVLIDEEKTEDNNDEESSTWW